MTHWKLSEMFCRQKDTGSSLPQTLRLGLEAAFDDKSHDHRAETRWNYYQHVTFELDQVKGRSTRSSPLLDHFSHRNAWRTV